MHLDPMAPVDECKIYGGKRAGGLLVAIGAWAIGCGTALLFVTEDPLPAFVLVSLPAWFLGAIALLGGIAGLAARIEIGRGCLRVAAPQWRGCPLPPVRRVNFPWDAIKAVRHRTEVYHLLPGRGLPFPVDAYAIDTENERVVFAGRSIADLAAAVSDIASRSGRPVQEEPLVQANIFSSFAKGPPCWR